MADISLPKPVKLFVGILSCNEELLPDVESSLVKRFGEVDIKSEVIPFDFTDYYTKDMGASISRQFICFRKLINPEELSAIKIWTNELEDKFKHNKQFDVVRPINLDPGYLTHCNLILASAKDYYHRIHLQNGIYAEVTLFYQHEVFKNGHTKPQYLVVQPEYAAKDLTTGNIAAQLVTSEGKSYAETQKIAREADLSSLNTLDVYATVDQAGLK